MDQPERSGLAEGPRLSPTDRNDGPDPRDRAALGVAMDVFYSEKSLYGIRPDRAALDDLRAKA